MNTYVLLSILMFISLGATVGFLSGLLGVGGGGILVPMLASIFGFIGINEPQILPMALGTSLACSLPTTATSAFTHHKKGAVLWHMVKLMSVGVVMGSALGIVIATNIDGKYLALIFAIFMAIVAVKMFSNWQPKPRNTPTKKVVDMCMNGFVGGCIGIISALISVGGAFFTILYVTYTGAEMKKAIGTASAVAFVSVSFATVGYLLANIHNAEALPYSIGYIYLPAFVLVTLASVLMVPLGTRLSHNLPNKKLKQLLGILCVILSVKLVWSMV